MIIYKSELPVIARHSLRDCHILGMDSVMFDNTPGRRVRAFICRPEHEMYHNVEGDRLSLSIHPHHCDIELRPIFGESYNVTPQPSPCPTRYAAWKYQSAITQSAGKMELLPAAVDLRCRLEAFRLTGPWAMPAKKLHTWYVPRGEEAAWMVNEGAEDSTYDPTCWSNADLSKFETSLLYKPMSVEYLLGLLDKMKVSVL